MFIKSIKNIWNFLGKNFNDFIIFIIDNKLTSLLVVAILGLAITIIVSSFQTNIVEYYLNKLFKTTNNNLIMFLISFVQFLIIILIIYLINKFMIKKIHEHYKVEENIKFDEISWKKEVLTEIQTLNKNINNCKK
jgi:large-conductance mechanosensitive channel